MAACYSRLGRLTYFVLLMSLAAGVPPALAAGHAITVGDPSGQAGAASPASSLTDLERSLERLGVPLRALRSRGPAAAGNATRGPAAPTGATSLVDPYWHPLTVIPRWNHSAVYDPVRGRVIVLMGAGLVGEDGPAYGGNGGSWFFGDAQALTLAGEPRWTPLATLPDGRRDQAAAVYDAANDRVLVHGGFFVGPVDGPPGYYCHAYDDLWELKLSAGSRWNRIRPAGTAPSSRYGHTGIYDPVRKRALFFGGTEHLWSATYCWTNTPLADLWELSLEGTPTWHQLLESGDIPAPGLRGTALYDPARDRMLFVAKDSVWVMTLDPAGSWTRLAVGGPGPAGGPAALDPARDRLLVLSGFQTWELPLAGALAWRLVTAQGAPTGNLRGFSVTWDPQGDRLVLFGGAVTSGTSLAIASDDTWFLSFGDGPRWERRLLRERELVLHKAVYDPVRDRMIAVGGNDNPGALVFSLDSPGGWSVLRAGGEGPPAPLIGHGAVYDAKRDRVLVYGGSILSTTALEDATRELSLAGTPRWSLLPAAPGEGQPCVLFSLVLDSRRDRLLLFGGQDAGGTLRNDVWQLGLADPAANWERVDVSGPGPSPRVLHDAVYDPVRDQMLVAGGETMEESSLGDLWALSLGETPHWTLLDPYGPTTSGETLVYDPVRDQLLMQFGTNPDAATWAWDLRQGGWTPLDLHCCGWNEFIPLLRIFHAAIYDPVRDQVVVSGGVDWYPPLAKAAFSATSGRSPGARRCAT
jgi:hypothetical protein